MNIGNIDWIGRRERIEQRRGRGTEEERRGRV
jgi:hypothetical protein